MNGLANSKLSKIFVGFIFFITCFSSAFSQTDKRIEEIRKIYQEVNKKVAECEQNGDTSTTFLTEIVVNKNDGPYPAVGIYKSVIKFYYTFGDREKNPYPNRLLKIAITTNRSATTETSEFLFNESGQLIFYFENKEETERRIYFFGEKPIQFLDGKKIIEPKSKPTIRFAQEIAKQRQKMVSIFQNSLEN